MRNPFIALFILLFFCVTDSFGQQKPLPDFFLKKGSKNTVIINWLNNFGDECIQLNVQRSSDSIRNFRTIFSTPAPQLPTNGFTDKNVPEGKVYYRIFYMLAGGSYFFTPSRQPVAAIIADTFQRQKAILSDLQMDTAKSIAIDSVKQPAVVANKAPEVKPSMISKNKWGNVVVKLSGADSYNYRMEIYNLAGDRVQFEIKRFENPVLILDKSTFMRIGKYKYLIYRADKVVEEGMLDIAK